ncbi:hypothetical protein CEUSTIGMA_g458.t1 [Chlamydomonas eustigma]|uniref:Sfi1 spindle body domain-containing protein n=1 Tax=Chlamydomonas eustigma TaxID=1157962 RepID=A0A250WQM9_9CHLO|nr:hypothetical protein CEUSTIGMA_g458.t1 [Chlamydomonas eustigma]|eukprot:GAX73006.1 hypothetical protein CEUSTIGMA_g458.t1 [Chlamydomonas eustigma]
MNKNEDSPNLVDISPTMTSHLRPLDMIQSISMNNTGPISRNIGSFGSSSIPDDVSSPPFQIHPLRSQNVEALQSSFEMTQHPAVGLHEVTSIAGSSRAGGSTAGSPGESRLMQRSQVSQPGLESGDVVMLLQQGIPFYTAIIDSDDMTGKHCILQLENKAHTSTIRGDADDEAAGPRSSCDIRATSEENTENKFLEVVRQGQYIGLRSIAAGGRFLQPRRKAPHPLIFFNLKLGIWEQWEVLGEEETLGRPWSRLGLTLRSRRLPQVELCVELVRVGQYRASAMSVRGSALSTVSELRELGAGGGVHELKEDEQLRRLNRVFIQEWMRFVDQEKMKRESVEHEVQYLVETLAELKINAISQIEVLRSEMHCEMTWLHEAVNMQEQQLMSWRLTRKRVIETAVAASWRRRAKALAQDVFMAWSGLLHKKKETSRMMETFRAGTAAKMLAASFYGIVRHTEWRLYRRAVMHKAVGAAAVRRMHMAFEAWKLYLVLRREKRQGLAAAVLHASNGLHSKAFLALCLHVQNRKQHRDKIQVAVNQACSKRCSHALTVLAQHAAHAALKRQQMRRVVAHVSRVYLQKAMTAWRCLVESAQESYILAQRHARYWTLVHALDSINNYTRQKVSQRKRELRVIQLLGNHRLHCALRAWKVAIQVLRKKQSSLRRSQAWHQRRIVRSAFSAWRRATFDSGVVRQRAEAMRFFFEQRLMHHVLASFQECVSARRIWRQSLESIRTQHEEQLVSRAFHSWWQDHAALRVFEIQVQKKQSRLAHKVLAYAFSRWSDFFSSALEAQAAAEQVLVNREHVMQSRVFTAWIHQWRVALQCKLLTAARQRARMVSCLHSWLEIVAHSLRARHVASIISRRRRRFILSACLAHWMVRASCEAYNGRCIALCQQHKEQRTLRSSFTAWCYFAIQREDLGHLRPPYVLMPMVCSADHAHRVLIRRQMATLLSVWLHLAQNRSQRRLQSILALSSHPKAVLAAFLSRACPSFHHSEEAELGGPQHLLLLSAFISWQVQASCTSRVRKRVQRMVHLHRERKSALVFNAWQSLVVQAERLAVRADRFRPWRFLRLGFAGLREEADRCKRLVAAALIFEQESQDLGRRQVLKAWQAHMRHRKAEVKQLIAAVNKMQRYKVRAVLFGWLGEVLHQKEWRSTQVSLFNLSLQAKEIGATWEAWRIHTDALKRGQDKAKSMFQRRQLQLLERSLYSWHAQCRTALEVKDKINRQLWRRQVCLLRSVVRGWADNCLLDNSLAGLEGALDRRRERRLKLKVVQLWLQLMMEARQNRCAADQWGAERRRKLLIQLVAMWKLVVKHHQMELEKLRACVMRKKIAFNHFKQWYWDAFDSDVQDTIRKVFSTTDSALQTTDDHTSSLQGTYPVHGARQSHYSPYSSLGGHTVHQDTSSSPESHSTSPLNQHHFSPHVLDTASTRQGSHYLWLLSHNPGSRIHHPQPLSYGTASLASPASQYPTRMSERSGGTGAHVQANVQEQPLYLRSRNYAGAGYSSTIGISHTSTSALFSAELSRYRAASSVTRSSTFRVHTPAPRSSLRGTSTADRSERISHSFHQTEKCLKTGASSQSLSGDSSVISHAPSVSFSTWAFSKELQAIRTANSILRGGASVQAETALHEPNMAHTGSGRAVSSELKQLRSDLNQALTREEKVGNKAQKAVKVPDGVEDPGAKAEIPVWNTLSENALFHAGVSQSSDSESDIEV